MKLDNASDIRTEFMPQDINAILLTDIYSDGSTVIKSKNKCTYLDLNRYSISDPKEMDKFVKSTEKIIRGSLEYREFVSYVRDTLAYNYCALTLESLEETDDIEIHHHPVTLYDIVKSTVSKLTLEQTGFNTFKVASEVIELHFQLRIGFIPLLGSLHKKFHNGYLDIPIELVVGNWKHWLDGSGGYKLDDEAFQKANYYSRLTIDVVTSMYQQNNKPCWYQGIMKMASDVSTLAAY